MRRSVLFSLVLAVGLLVGCAGQQSTPSSPNSPASGSPTGPAVHGKVTGVVTDADNQPVQGVMIGVTSLDDPARPIPEIAIVTDADGRYTWSLPPGEYRLTANQAQATVTVTAGATVQADLRLS